MDDELQTPEVPPGFPEGPEKTVLLVDDEEGVLSSLRRLLRKEGYRLYCAGSGEEGLRLLEEHPVDLVISDQRMPQMEGTVFLQKVKERWPRTIRVILSGYAEPALVVESINKGEVYRFFPKPWDDEELRAGIRQCMAQHDLQEENRRLLERIRQQNEQLRMMNVELERVVESRTLSLRLAQEIVECMPLCTFGISLEGEILLCNASGQKMMQARLGHSCMPGSPADEVFPPSLLEIMDQVLEEGKSVESEFLRIEERLFYAYCAPLGYEGGRGLLLILRDREPLLQKLQGQGEVLERMRNSGGMEDDADS